MRRFLPVRPRRGFRWRRTLPDLPRNRHLLRDIGYETWDPRDP